MKEDATEILNSCSIDVRYWFVKPLVKIGAEFPISTIEFAIRTIEQKKTYAHTIFDDIPDMINGFKLVIKTANNESYDNLFKKMKKIENDKEFGHIMQDYIYRKFIRDVTNKHFKNIKEIERIANSINKHVVKKDVCR